MEFFKKLLFLSSLVFAFSATALFAQDASTANSNLITLMLNVQIYERAIHIMVMLILGFGFLMVFVRKYGRSALTATFLLVSIAIPLYFMMSNFGFLHIKSVQIQRLIFAEFAAASLLITAGAVLGRLKMHQYIVLGIFFVLSYMLNEWIVINGATKLIPNRWFCRYRRLYSNPCIWGYFWCIGGIL